VYTLRYQQTLATLAHCTTLPHTATTSTSTSSSSSITGDDDDDDEMSVD